MPEHVQPERQPYEQNYYPPVPLPFTRAMRTNPVWQFFRFMVLNMKMLRMARKH
jgi:hypothetical protein